MFLTHLHADHVGDRGGGPSRGSGHRAAADGRLHTGISELGSVAERARVRELILSHYLPADPDAIPEAEWAERAGRGFTGTTTAGRDGLRRTLQRAIPSWP